MTPVRVVFLGPPGAGKGTQAVRLAQQYGIPRISTGDILRHAVHAGTDIGRLVKHTVERGELVADDLVMRIVSERVSRADARRGFVLDGFPRTVEQAQGLEELMLGRGGVIAIDIMVGESELIRRLASRMVCRDCGVAADAVGPACRACGGPLMMRGDDKEAVVLERLALYRRVTAPLVAFYRSRAQLYAVDGAKASDLVGADIRAIVERRCAGRAASTESASEGPESVIV